MSWTRARSIRAAALLGVLGLSGCSDAAEAPGSDVATIRIALSTVGTPDTVLGEIRDLVIAREGYWIAAAGRVGLAHYGADLSDRAYPDVTAVGPNQVRATLSLDVSLEDRALVWDGILGRIVEIERSGDVHELVAGPRWLQMPQAPGWDFLGGTRNQVLALRHGAVAGFLDQSRAGSGDFHRLVFRPVSAADSSAVLRFATTRSWLDSALTTSRLFAPFPLVARCGRDRVAIYRPTDQTIEIVDSNWAPIQVMPVRRTLVDRTPERAQALFIARLIRSTQGKVPLEEIVRRVTSAPPQAFAEAASVLPAYLNLLCTPGGRVLIEDSRIERPQANAGAVREAHLPGGREYRFEFPPRFTLLDASDEVLVGVLLDSLDVPSIAIARWPPVEASAGRGPRNP